MNLENKKALKVSLLLAGLFLCLALLPGLPAGYFGFLRLFVCAASVYAVFELNNNQALKPHVIVLALLATLFNPLIPVQLTGSLWMFIHLATALYFSVLAKKI